MNGFAFNVKTLRIVAVMMSLMFSISMFAACAKGDDELFETKEVEVFRTALIRRSPEVSDLQVRLYKGVAFDVFFPSEDAVSVKAMESVIGQVELMIEDDYVLLSEAFSAYSKKFPDSNPAIYFRFFTLEDSKESSESVFKLRTHCVVVAPAPDYSDFFCSYPEQLPEGMRLPGAQ